jgi:hypothetical protein
MIKIMNNIENVIRSWFCAVVELRTLFVWWHGWGVGFCASATFARYDDSGSCYGPYTLWFERVCWPLYRAVTPPANPIGWTLL